MQLFSKNWSFIQSNNQNLANYP